MCEARSEPVFARYPAGFQQILKRFLVKLFTGIEKAMVA